MTRPRLTAVGCCARITEAGDWAFRFAFELARANDAQLSIFFFPTSPCESHPKRGRRGEHSTVTYEESVEVEKRVRLYYDDFLEDYVKVGFRLCMGDEAPELRRCLLDREYDVLVLPYERRGCPFGERTIEDFSQRMQCPVVLVGPEGEDEFHLNSPARLWAADLGLASKRWRPVERPPDREDGPDGSEWSELARALAERERTVAWACDRRGNRLTSVDGGCHPLCEAIRADRRSADRLCRLPPESGAWAGRPVIDRCPAGLTRVWVPVPPGDEPAGFAGCCGVLEEGCAVDAEAISSATGLSSEAVATLARRIPRLSREAIEALAGSLRSAAETAPASRSTA
jgi:hypothetical protein